MSEPFTIDSGDITSWQESAEELRLAVSERSKAAGREWRRFQWLQTGELETDGVWQWVDGDGSDDDRLPDRFNLQAHSFWYGIQQEVESFCDDFATGEDLAGVTRSAARNTAEFADFEELCEYIGGNLYTSPDDFGWQRALEKDESGEPVMVRGRHQAVDYIGSWVVEDLVAVFNALRFVYATPSVVDAGSMVYAGEVSRHYDRPEGTPAGERTPTMEELNSQMADTYAAALVAAAVPSPSTSAGVETRKEMPVTTLDYSGWGFTTVSKYWIYTRISEFPAPVTPIPISESRLYAWFTSGTFNSSGVRLGSEPALYGADVPMYQPSLSLVLHDTNATGAHGPYGNNGGPATVPYNPGGDWIGGIYEENVYSKNAGLGFCAVRQLDFTNGPQEE